MNLGIRLRLTILYFSFFAVAAALLSLASWVLLKHSLDALLMHELDERIDDLEDFLSTETSVTTVAQVRDSLLAEYRLKDEGKWLQVVTDRGEYVYFSSRGHIADPLPALPRTGFPVQPFTIMPGHAVHTLQRTIQVHGQSWSASMGISADLSVEILGHFRSGLLLLVPVVLLSAAGVGHFLSRRALDPVRAMAAEMRRINERNLSTRLPVLGPRDEIYLLSETINNMLGRIDAAFRSVRVLTANASHELRTPLSLIRTRTEIALSLPLPADYYQIALREILDETVRMTTLIGNLLTMARYESGANQPEKSPVNLSGLLRKAARDWRLAAERFSLAVELDCCEDALWVLGDADLIERILRALLDNACRYTPAGGIIRLRGESCGDSILVSVTDNGIGIAEEDLPRIFERFYRVPQPMLHDNSRGSGLGLSLALWIAEQHKATITVQSAVGSGSTFKVKFPAFRGHSLELDNHQGFGSASVKPNTKN